MASKNLKVNVFTAINEQNQFKGSTVNEIVCFLKSEPSYRKIPKKTLMPQVKDIVKRATLKGVLEGSRGRYRIGVKQGKSQGLRRHDGVVSRKTHRKRQSSTRGKKQDKICDRNCRNAKTCSRGKATKTNSRGLDASDRCQQNTPASPSGFAQYVEDLEVAGNTLLAMVAEMRATSERRRHRAANPSRQNLLVKSGGGVAPTSRRQPTPFPDSDNEYGVPNHDEDDESMAGNFQNPVPYYQHGILGDDLPSTSGGEGSSHELWLRRICKDTLTARQSSMSDLTEDSKNVLQCISINDLITQVKGTLGDHEDTMDDDDDDVSVTSASSTETLINSDDEDESINGLDDWDVPMDTEDEQYVTEDERSVAGDEDSVAGDEESVAEDGDNKEENKEGDLEPEAGENNGDHDEEVDESSDESTEKKVEEVSPADKKEVDDKAPNNAVPHEEAPKQIVKGNGDVPLVGDGDSEGAQD